MGHSDTALQATANPAYSAGSWSSQGIRLLSPSDPAALPPIDWRIKGVLPSQGIAVLYGKSGAGKSFLALDMAAAIAGAADWFGYRVTNAPVVYVALEGSGGFQNRVKAWEKTNGYAFPTEVSFVLQPLSLLREEDRAALASLVPKGAVVILDTLNRATAGADENSPSHMGLVIDAAMRLAAAFEGLVLFIHHPGKDSGKGMRGHSSLPAACDGIIKVSKSAGMAKFMLEKVKDGKDGASHEFRLASVDLGKDADGDPTTSCAIESTSILKLVRDTPLPQGKHQRTAMDVIKRELASTPAFPAGAEPPSYPSGRAAIRLDDCVRAVAAELDVKSDKRTSSARKALEGMLDRGVIPEQDGWIWLP